MSKKYLRQRRVFSPTLRKEIVGLIESGKLSVAVACREYQVSAPSIYNWMHRYSTYNKKGMIGYLPNSNRPLATNRCKSISIRSTWKSPVSMWEQMGL
jgi:transposase-like protein